MVKNLYLEPAMPISLAFQRVSRATVPFLTPSGMMQVLVAPECWLADLPHRQMHHRHRMSGAASTERVLGPVEPPRPA